MSWEGIATLITSIAALAGVILTWRKLRPEEEKAEAESDKAKVDINRGLWEEVQRVQVDVLKLQSDLITANQQLSLVREHERICNERVALLESMMPLGALVHRIEDLAAVAQVMDRVETPFVISSIKAGGTFGWVNLAFASALGMTREEVLSAGWKNLVNPDDLDDTMKTEATAWDRAVDGFVNRYRHASGGWRRFRWWSSSYDLRGYAISVAIDLGMEDAARDHK